MKLLIPFLLLLSTQAFSGFMPKNNLGNEDQKHRKITDLTEERFLKLANQVMDTFNPYAEAHGKTLTLEPLWDSIEVNAYAYPTDDLMVVQMHGGLARRPEVTEDGFQLVVCHETGHHLAGFAKYDPESWAGSEGQSDYFASHVCAKEIWKEDFDKNAMYETIAPKALKDNCNNSYQEDAERYLCYRTGMAGYSLATLLSFGGEVDLAARDGSVVEETYVSHPDAQCRLDTYVSGGLCTVAFDKEAIPQTEEEARESSCMRVDEYKLEARPLCWFAPTLVVEPKPEEFSVEGVLRGEGIYGLKFSNVIADASYIKVYWGFDSWYAFAILDVVGSEFVTKKAWGLGDDLELKIEVVDGQENVLFTKLVTLK